MKVALISLIIAGTLVGCGSDSAGARFARPGLDRDVAAPAPVETKVTEPAGCCPGRSYKSRATGYFPYNDAMEGGYVDRKGRPLRTLQDYLDGKVDYVSVSMDATVAPYGTRLCIPEIEDSYGRSIEFRLVDTGGAFKNKKTSKLDICSRDRKSAHLRAVNRAVTVVICSE